MEQNQIFLLILDPFGHNKEYCRKDVKLWSCSEEVSSLCCEVPDESLSQDCPEQALLRNPCRLCQDALVSVFFTRLMNKLVK